MTSCRRRGASGSASSSRCTPPRSSSGRSALGAPVIGVNNRDLQTLTTSLAPSLRLLPLIPPGPVAVSESGITTRRRRGACRCRRRARHPRRRGAGARHRRPGQGARAAARGGRRDVMRVKICGITNLEDAGLCVEAGADALGFIFVEGTPRFITPEAAARIIAELPPFVTSGRRVLGPRARPRQGGARAVRTRGAPVSRERAAGGARRPRRAHHQDDQGLRAGELRDDGPLHRVGLPPGFSGAVERRGAARADSVGAGPPSRGATADHPFGGLDSRQRRRRRSPGATLRRRRQLRCRGAAGQEGSREGAPVHLPPRRPPGTRRQAAPGSIPPRSPTPADTLGASAAVSSPKRS